MKTCLVCAAEHKDAEPTCTKCGEASWSDVVVAEVPAPVAVEDVSPMSKRGNRR